MLIYRTADGLARGDGQLSFTQQVAVGGPVPTRRPQGFSLVATGQNLSDFF
jgi:hypothetical protein